MNILVANIGSTSFKYRLYESESARVLAEGKVERVRDYGAAIAKCMASLPVPPDAVGFKAVHAGALSGARLVDGAVLAAMEEYSFFAPAHNPPYIKAMQSFREALPDVPLVALFETAFFDRVDVATSAYAVPWEWRETLGIRRYGFHGASHRAASEAVQTALGRTDLRHISCHLGGSSSLAAICNGVAVDCSFGMSPQSGLPHNNRTGDLDAFAVLYVMKKLGLSVDETARILACESGLAGVSGTSGDLRDVEAAGTERARIALDMFVEAIRKYLGAFLVKLGGVDALSFSGGIGENSRAIRARVCAGLDEFGIIYDGERSSGRCTVLVVPADEERIVARATAEVMQHA